MTVLLRRAAVGTLAARRGSDASRLGQRTEYVAMPRVFPFGKPAEGKLRHGTVTANHQSLTTTDQNQQSA
jgi:hypothetical protein